MLKEQALQVLDELAHQIISQICPCKLVVGLSGGADSTLVLLIAHHIRNLDSRYSVQAVHCIHGIDADDPIWFNHCTALCKRLEIALDTPKLKIVYGGGLSPEDVSRQERYRALLEHTKDGGVLMLGHQADDQVESFFLALKRGSGPYGLSGMRFMIKDERGTIIRPLLSLNKATIIEIIEALGFSHVFDISNTYLKFERNFIRLKVLPLLKERFSGLDKSVLRSQMLCSYEHDLAYRYTKEQFDKVFDKDTLSLDINLLNLNDMALLTSLLRLFICTVCSMPPEFSTILQVVNLCSIGADQKVVINLEGGYSLRRFRHRLYLVKDKVAPTKGCYQLKLNESLKLGDYTYELVSSNDPKLCFYQDSVILDFNLKGSLILKPNTRLHSRNLKKLYVEYDVPAWKRDALCLVKDHQDKILALGNLFSCVSPIAGKIGYTLKISS